MGDRRKMSSASGLRGSGECVPAYTNGPVKVLQATRDAGAGAWAAGACRMRLRWRFFVRAHANATIFLSPVRTASVPRLVFFIDLAPNTEVPKVAPHWAVVP